MLKNKRPILITGSHRSGTTWAGKVISESSDIFYLHEPFSPKIDYWYGADNHNTQFDHWFTYINQKNEKDYLPQVKKLLKSDYSFWEELRYTKNFKQFLKDYWRFKKQRRNPKRLLIKDPIALFSAEWLAKRFNFQVVVLVRHPAAFTSSLKRLNWVFDFNEFLNQKELMKNYLTDFRDEIHEFASNEQNIVEQACLLWRVFNSVIYDYQKKHSDWLFYRYEDVATAPQQKFREIFKKLRLNYTPEIERYIIDISGKKNPHDYKASGRVPLLPKLDSRGSINNFVNRLSEKEISLIKEKTADVWKLFYKENDWL